MVDIKLLIEVNPNQRDEKIDSVKNNNAKLSNVSVKTNLQQNFIDVPAQESSSNGLVWAYKYENSDDDYLVFNSEDYVDNVEYSNGYLESEENSSQLVWGVVPESKNYSVKLTLQSASTLKEIVVYGDRQNNQFPTEAILNGTQTIYSDDPVWAISFGTDQSTQTIEFTRWNRANYNAVISGISVLGQYIEVNNATIKEFNSLSEIQDGDNISYDVIPSYGSFSIIDRDGEIKDAINSKIITDSNIGLKLYINNKLVRSHISTSSEYDVFGNLFKTEASDFLDIFGEKEIQGFTQASSTSLFLVVYEVLSKFGYTYEDVVRAFRHSMFYNGDTIYGTIKSFMERVKIQYPSFAKIKVRDFLSQLCQTLSIGGRLDSNGKLEFFSLRPKMPSYSKIISIPLKHQFSKPSANMFPIDVYKKVIVSGSVTEPTTDTSTYNSVEIYKVSDGQYYKKTQAEFLFGNANSKKEYQTTSNNIFMDTSNTLDVNGSNRTIIQEFADNVLSDYSEGNDVVSLKVSFNDYFDVNGDRIVNATDGEFIDVGCVGQIDKNNNGESRFTNLDGLPKHWYIVSSEIVKSGVPFVQLSARGVNLVETSNKVEQPYFTTKPSLISNIEYTINCPTEGAKIIQYADDTYTTIEQVFNDGEVFFIKGTSLINVTMYFKAIKDGFEESKPFVFTHNTQGGSGGDIIQPL